MEESRVDKSIKNTTFGMIGLAVSLLVQFISRTIFIKLLGDEYNGINGLFTNILSVLNLAELGFAYSIAYALYAPLQSADKEKICAIMNYLRKIYYLIAVVVGVAGLICVPFLQYLIKEDISTLPFALKQIRIYFVVYLANTVFSYIWSYKRTLITADQKTYLVSNADNLSNILLYSVQIVLLLIWKNYYLYLVLMLVKTIGTNVVLTFIADKKYPFLKENRNVRLNKEECGRILKNVGAMFFHKVGSVVIYGTTTIIISAFVSLIEAGWYSNYVLIVSAVSSFINIIFNSITASVGNLCVTADKEYQKKVFSRISYVANFLAIFAFVCYVVLFNDFVTLWVGGDKTFSLAVIVVISASSMITILRSAPNTFKNAQGLFVKDWYKPIVEAGIAIILAIVFSFVWGTFGVLFGYMLGAIVAVPIENMVLYKYGFEGTKKEFFEQLLRLLGCALLAGAMAALVYFICSFMPQGLGWFIIKAVFSVCFVCVLYVALTFRTDGFHYYKNMSKDIFKKIFKRNKN